MQDDVQQVLAIHQRVVAVHLRAANQHALADTLAPLSPDCVFEGLALDNVYRGREGAAEYYRTWWNAFDVTVNSHVHHGTIHGHMIAEARYVGTHVGGRVATDGTLH